MFPPELESTKYDGERASLPRPTDPWGAPLPHPHAFWHALIAFCLANFVFAYLAGGFIWQYALAALAGFAFAFRWARNLATLPWIYGFAATMLAVGLVLYWLHVA